MLYLIIKSKDKKVRKYFNVIDDLDRYTDINKKSN